ncbi:MAG: flavin reductase [Defluviitaleaceae bacterium]|nr:flavin reductase [Defluviitaleaceae bacterium]
MHSIRSVTSDLFWVGADDRRLAMFEGVYSVPAGVSYNAYLLMDEKIVLFDTVDRSVRHRFMENITEVLKGKPLDFLIVQHMEPDHSAGIGELVKKFPDMQVVCNAKTLAFIKQFHDLDITGRALVVKEGDTLVTGRHTLHFVMAPMVHWPEVMVTYDSADKILFSADAFGCFGALNGALFADEVDFTRDYMDEARRYYTNIVGKYGAQVASLLGKASTLAIEMICPLHGFVWRGNITDILSKYTLWSRYEPEERGVMIAYASVYGNTENAAEILSTRLRERGVKTVMYDVSVTPASEIVSAAFRWSHLVFASTTYNAGIFITMEALINDLTAHNIQNRTVAIIENGSWAPTSGGLIRTKFEQCKNIKILDNIISIRSAVKTEQLAEILSLADALAVDFEKVTSVKNENIPQKQAIDTRAMFKLSYGLFVLTAHTDGQDNGCIINTVTQITESPLRISVAVNKANHTHNMIVKSGAFNVSVLAESAPFRLFERFGFHSGRDTDKFADDRAEVRSANGIRYIAEHTNAMISAKVCEAFDYGSHTLFIAEVVEAAVLSPERSATYQYYFDRIKPAPQKPSDQRKGFVCKICGYVYEGETLPEDIVCPLCKHGAGDFEPV